MTSCERSLKAQCSCFGWILLISDQIQLHTALWMTSLVPKMRRVHFLFSHEMESGPRLDQASGLCTQKCAPTASPSERPDDLPKPFSIQSMAKTLSQVQNSDLALWRSGHFGKFGSCNVTSWVNWVSSNQVPIRQFEGNFKERGKKKQKHFLAHALNLNMSLQQSLHCLEYTLTIFDSLVWRWLCVFKPAQSNDDTTCRGKAIWGGKKHVRKTWNQN